MAIASSVSVVATQGRQTLWQGQEEAYQKARSLTKVSARQVWGERKLRRAFTGKPETIGCVDERLGLLDPEKGYIALAGSGIFLEQHELLGVIEAAKHATGIKQIRGSWHQACAAVDAHCTKFELGHSMKTGCLDRDQQARTAAHRIHQLDHSQGLPVKLGYGEGFDMPMSGSLDFHHARGAIIDGDGTFLPGFLDLPVCFRATAAYSFLKYVWQELKLMLSVAFSSAGWGERFTPWQPFLVVVVSHPTNADRRGERILRFLKSAIEPYGKRVETLILEP